MANENYVGNTSIFEKTMAACLESKRVATNKSNKLSENKKAKKTATSKRVNESVKKSRIKTEDEDEIVDPELDSEVDDTMDDIEDDIVVVTDPELDPEDIDGVASDMQEIIDDTPDGEVPEIDDYIGDYTYTCPICGNTFFSEVEMHDGDECPVCGDFPNGYVLVGEIASTDDTEDGEDLDDESDVDDFDDTEISEEEDLEVDDSEADDEDVVESKRPTRRSSRNRRVEKKSIYSVDETSFHPFMNKFIRENYKNARAFNIKSATRTGKRLSLECIISFKSGNKKAVTLTCENFVPAKSMTLAFKESGAFKTESSKRAPFTIKASLNRGNIIKCEGFNYNFITKIEGKKANIYGNLIRESKRPSKRTNRR